jgi:hypothetical protein
MNKLKLYSLTLIALSLIAVAIFGVNKLEGLQSIISSTENEILNHYHSDGITQQFAVTTQDPSLHNLEALFYHLQKHEGLVRALLTLNERELISTSGTNYLYNDNGEILTGASPVFLLNLLSDGKIQSHELEAIQILEVAWVQFINTTKLGISDQHVIDYHGLLSSYQNLVTKVSEISTLLEPR